MVKIIKLIIALIITQLAGLIGSIFTAPSIKTWYTTINKPSFNPPNWVFGPVWIFLFILMGISLYLVWEKGFKSKENKMALNLFTIQLILNIFWSILFFGLHSPLFAFIEIILLWIMILFTMLKFYKISKSAAYLLIPYLAWVTFAAFLNLSIVLIN